MREALIRDMHLSLGCRRCWIARGSQLCLGGALMALCTWAGFQALRSPSKYEDGLELLGWRLLESVG